MQFKSLVYLAAVAAAAPNLHRPGSPESIKNLKDKIKNVVIMVMENRSFDNLMGGQTLAGLENPIQTGPYCNPLNISNPGTGTGCTEALDFDSIINDPDHSISGNNLEFYGSFTPDNAAIKAGTLQPDMSGFLTEQIRLYGKKADEQVLQTQVINYYTETQVPVITALTQNFVVFNHWHSDVPGPTNPNRVALCSGTSAGKGKNNFQYNTMTQRSIFQEVTELGLEWKDYLVDTSIQDARWFTWTYESNNTDRIVFMDEFYEDARQGTLPHLAYINPSCCGVGTNSMHPTGRVSDGEQLIKDVYEALRGSPQWHETLWIVTFDETGGFHDHVPPPRVARPDNATHSETTPTGADYTFAFDRLGGRMPTWLVSPWAAPAVEQKGVDACGRTVSYHATSILRTLGYLWGFAPYNPRVKGAPSFDHLIGTELRTDVPDKFPTVSHFPPQQDLQTVVQSRAREWHFHIYFLLQSPTEKAAALALRDAVLRLRRDGKYNDRVFFFFENLPLTTQRRFCCGSAAPSQRVSHRTASCWIIRDVLIHPLTTLQRRDHEFRNGWLGKPWPIYLGGLPIESAEVPLQYPELRLGWSTAPEDELSLDERRKKGAELEALLAGDPEAAPAPAN
ncbi:phosphoesterase superfamily [Cordyceps militaris]|uniref:Phosphoesterase superfamily n=1 Tax=Cordyceps militaris TaxID=73501 RepID=A0A2H4SNB1_CORMI|nr:phosphoesterase superfamily [Cordyceps militaris]